jgi:hypothetical protein
MSDILDHGRVFQIVLLDGVVWAKGEECRSWAIVGHTKDVFDRGDSYIRDMFRPDVPYPSFPMEVSS